MFETNDDLYDQIIDDEGNLLSKNQPNESPYEAEYNKVIEIMSKLCQNIVWNNNPVNQDRKLRINEDEILALAPRIWALSQEYEK